MALPIKITIFDLVNSTKHEMELLDETTADVLINSMINRGKIKRTNEKGQPVVYELVTGKGASGGPKKILKRLKDAGVQNGDQLTLRSEIEAA